MTGTFKVFTLVNIPIRVHWSFGLLFIALGLLGIRTDAGGFNIALVCFFVSVLFLCVVLHELGHALAASYYHIKTHDIIILPIGGIARLEKLPDKPSNEFFVALAGPAVNVVLVLLLGLFLTVTYGSPFLNTGELFGEIRAIDHPKGFLFLLQKSNLYLAIFNMVPAFPLDGGRVFRALLSIKLGRLRATQIATVLGQALALLIAMYGFWSSDFVVIVIAGFIFFTALSEYKTVATEEKLEGYTVADIMRTVFSRLTPEMPVDVAYENLKRGMEGSFLVFDEQGALLGILDEEAVIRAAKNGQLAMPAGQLLTKDFTAAHPTDNLRKIYMRMQQEHHSLLPVMEDGQIIGVLDDNALDTLLRILRKKKG